MSLGSFLSTIGGGLKGIMHVAEKLPGIGDTIKSVENNFNKVGDAVEAVDQHSDTPQSYNTNAETEEQGKAGVPQLGNFMQANKAQGAEGAKEAQEAQVAQNAAKEAAAKEAAAKEVAAMLV
jgi:hypothetical protein